MRRLIRKKFMAMITGLACVGVLTFGGMRVGSAQQVEQVEGFDARAIKNVQQKKGERWKDQMHRLSVVDSEIRAADGTVRGLTKEFNELSCGQAKPPIGNDQRCREIAEKLDEKIEEALELRAERARILTKAYSERSQANKELADLTWGLQRNTNADSAQPRPSKMALPMPNDGPVGDLYAQLPGYGLTNQRAQEVKARQKAELEELKKMKKQVANGNGKTAKVPMAMRAMINYRADRQLSKLYAGLAKRYAMQAKYVATNSLAGNRIQEPEVTPSSDYPKRQTESGPEEETETVTEPVDRSFDSQVDRQL